MDSHPNGRININSGHDEARYTKSSETLVAPGFTPPFCNSVSTSKRDVQTTRPCAVIGPDRIIPQQARIDNFASVSSNMPWPPTNGETSYYRFPPMSQYPEHFYPPRNISPRHTFQENMARIVVPPRHDLAAGPDIMQNIPSNYPPDGSVYFSKAMKPNTSSLKHPEVPYVVNRASSEHRQRFVHKSSEVYISKFDNPITVAPQIPNPNVPMQPWHQVPVPPYHNPYGNSMSSHRHPKEFHPCATPIYRSANPSYKKPENGANCFDPTFYRSPDLRYEPYSVKEKYSHPRYEYGYHIPGQLANANYAPAPKYNDFPQSVISQPVQFPYPSLPHKYMDNRVTNPAEECYQKVTVGRTLPSYNLQYRHGDNFKLNLDDPASNSQGKLYSYEVLEMNNRHHTLPKNMESDKVQYEFPNAIRNINFPDNRIQNDLNYPNVHKHLPFYSHPPVNTGIPPRISNHNMAYINKPIENQHFLRNYESDMNSQYKPYDGRQHACNPLARIPTEFSPNIISPTDSNTSLESSHSLPQHLNQEDCGYVSQCSTASGKSIDYNIHTNKYYHLDHSNMRMADERQTFNSPSYMLPPKGGHCKQILDMNKEKEISKAVKQIDVRQYLQMWDEELEDNIPIHSKHATEQITVKLPEIQTVSSRDNGINTDQLYVLDLMNIPSDDLKMYEHVQKVTKLPDNIKGYDNIELLKQFDEIVQSKPDVPFTKQQSQVPNNIKYTTGIVSNTPRPISPLDVEAKISQSVIHKEVGCNFEIRPCSPVKIGIEIQVLPPAHTDFTHSVESINYPKVNPNTVLDIKDLDEPNRAFDQIDEVLKKNLGRKREKRKLKLNIEETTSNKSSKYCHDYKVQYPDYKDLTEENLEHKKPVQLASLPQLDCDDDVMIPIATDINTLLLDTPVEPANETVHLQEMNKIENNSKKDTRFSNQLLSFDNDENDENVAINMSNDVKNVTEYPCIEIVSEHVDLDKPPITNTETVGHNSHKLSKYRKMKSSNSTAIAQLYTVDSTSLQIMENFHAEESILTSDYNLDEMEKCGLLKKGKIQEREETSIGCINTTDITETNPNESAYNYTSTGTTLTTDNMYDETKIDSFVNTNINLLCNGYKNEQCQLEKSAVIPCISNGSTVIVKSLETEVTGNQACIKEPHSTNSETSTLKKNDKFYTKSFITLNKVKVFENIKSMNDNGPVKIVKQNNNEIVKTSNARNETTTSNESSLLSGLCNTTCNPPDCLYKIEDGKPNNKIKMDNVIKKNLNLSVLCLKVLSGILFSNSEMYDKEKLCSKKSSLNNKFYTKLTSNELFYPRQEIDENPNNDITLQSHLVIEKVKQTENVHNSNNTANDQNDNDHFNDKNSRDIISCRKNEFYENLQKNNHANQNFSEIMHVFPHTNTISEYTQNISDNPFVDTNGFIADSMSEILDLSYSSNRTSRLYIPKNIPQDSYKTHNVRITHTEKKHHKDILCLTDQINSITNLDVTNPCSVEDTSLSMSLYDSVESYLDDINISLDKSRGCASQGGIGTDPYDMVVRKYEPLESHLPMKKVTSNPYDMVLVKVDTYEDKKNMQTIETNLSLIQKESVSNDYCKGTGAELENNSLKGKIVAEIKNIGPDKNNSGTLSGINEDVLFKNQIDSNLQNILEMQCIINVVSDNPDLEEKNENNPLTENTKPSEISQYALNPLLKNYKNNLQIVDDTDKNNFIKVEAINEKCTKSKRERGKNGFDKKRTLAKKNNQYKNANASHSKNAKSDKLTGRYANMKNKGELTKLDPIIIAQTKLSKPMAKQSDTFPGTKTPNKTEYPYSIQQGNLTSSIAEHIKENQYCTNELSTEKIDTTSQQNKIYPISTNCIILEDLNNITLAQKLLNNNENQVNSVHVEPMLNDSHINNSLDISNSLKINSIKDTKSNFYKVTKYIAEGHDTDVIKLNDVTKVLNLSSSTEDNLEILPQNPQKQNTCNKNLAESTQNKNVSFAEGEIFLDKSNISINCGKSSHKELYKQYAVNKNRIVRETSILDPLLERYIQTNENTTQNSVISESNFELNKESEFINRNNQAFRQTSVITYPSDGKYSVDKLGYNIYLSNNDCPPSSEIIVRDITPTNLSISSQINKASSSNAVICCETNITDFLNENTLKEKNNETKTLCQSTFKDELCKIYTESEHENITEIKNAKHFLDNVTVDFDKNVISTLNANIQNVTTTTTSVKLPLKDIHQVLTSDKNTQSFQDFGECESSKIIKLKTDEHSNNNINIKENKNNYYVPKNGESISTAYSNDKKNNDNQNNQNFSNCNNKVLRSANLLKKNAGNDKTFDITLGPKILASNKNTFDLDETEASSNFIYSKNLHDPKILENVENTNDVHVTEALSNIEHLIDVHKHEILANIKNPNNVHETDTSTNFVYSKDSHEPKILVNSNEASKSEILSNFDNLNDVHETEALSNYEDANDSQEPKILVNIKNTKNVDKTEASSNFLYSKDSHEPKILENIENLNEAHESEFVSNVENLSDVHEIVALSNIDHKIDADKPEILVNITNSNELHKLDALSNYEDANDLQEPKILANIKNTNDVDETEASSNFVYSKDSHAPTILANIKNTSDVDEIEAQSNFVYSKDSHEPKILENIENLNEVHESEFFCKVENLNDVHGTEVLSNIKHKTDADEPKILANITNSNELHKPDALSNYKDANDSQEPKILPNIENTNHVNETEASSNFVYSKDSVYELKILENIENSNEAHVSDIFSNVENLNDIHKTKALPNIENLDASEPEILANITNSNELHKPDALPNYKDANDSQEPKILPNIENTNHVNETEASSNFVYSKDSVYELKILVNIENSDEAHVSDIFSNVENLNDIHTTKALSNIENLDASEPEILANINSLNEVLKPEALSNFEDANDTQEPKILANIKNSNEVHKPNALSNFEYSNDSREPKILENTKNSNETSESEALSNIGHSKDINGYEKVVNIDNSNDTKQSNYTIKVLPTNENSNVARLSESVYSLNDAHDDNIILNNENLNCAVTPEVLMNIENTSDESVSQSEVIENINNLTKAVNLEKSNEYEAKALLIITKSNVPKAEALSIIENFNDLVETDYKSNDKSEKNIQDEGSEKNKCANNIKINLIKKEYINESGKAIQVREWKDIKTDNTVKNESIYKEGKAQKHEEGSIDIKCPNNIIKINLIVNEPTDKSGKDIQDEKYIKYVNNINNKNLFKNNCSHDVNSQENEQTYCAGRTDIQEEGDENNECASNIKSNLIENEFVNESVEDTKIDYIKCANNLIDRKLFENNCTDNVNSPEYEQKYCANEIDIQEEGDDDIKSTNRIIKRNLIKNEAIYGVNSIEQEYFVKGNDIQEERDMDCTNLDTNVSEIVPLQDNEHIEILHGDAMIVIENQMQFIHQPLTMPHTVLQCVVENEMIDENVDNKGHNLIIERDNCNYEKRQQILFCAYMPQQHSEDFKLSKQSKDPCFQANTLSPSPLEISHDYSNENFSYESNFEGSKFEDCWIDDVACVETVISEEISGQLEDSDYDTNENNTMNDQSIFNDSVYMETECNKEKNMIDVVHHLSESDSMDARYSNKIQVSDLKPDTDSELCRNEILDSTINIKTTLFNESDQSYLNEQNLSPKNIQVHCNSLPTNLESIMEKCPSSDLNDRQNSFNNIKTTDLLESPKSLETIDISFQKQSNEMFDNFKINTLNDFAQKHLVGVREKRKIRKGKKETNKKNKKTTDMLQPLITSENIDVLLEERNNKKDIEKKKNKNKLLLNNTQKYLEYVKNIKIAKRKISTKLKEYKKTSISIEPLDKSGNFETISQEQCHGLHLEKKSDSNNFFLGNPLKHFEADKNVKITKRKMSTKFTESKKTISSIDSLQTFEKIDLTSKESHRLDVKKKIDNNDLLLDNSLKHFEVDRNVKITKRKLKTISSIETIQTSKHVDLISEDQSHGLNIAEMYSNDNNLLQNNALEVHKKIKEMKSKFLTNPKESKKRTDHKEFFYRLHRHSNNSNKEIIPFSCTENSTIGNNSAERKRISLKIYQSRSKLKKDGKQTKDEYEDNPSYSCTAIESVLREEVIDNKQFNNETVTNCDSLSVKGVKKQLITKAAQKYIPPISPDQFNFKVRLPLPKNSLLGFQKIENKCSKIPQNDFHIKDVKDKSKIEIERCHRIPKVKPKFDDVLRTIDDMQKSLIKSKSKKDNTKETVPKMIIKKNEHGAHYASSTVVPKEKFNPDLTGRKWQPWVHLEKNNFIEKMIRRNKKKTLYYLAIDRYKVVPIKKSINSNTAESTSVKLASHTTKEENENVSKPLKCTIKLKSNSNEMTNRKHPRAYTSQHITTQNHNRYQAENKNY